MEHLTSGQRAHRNPPSVLHLVLALAWLVGCMGEVEDRTPADGPPTVGSVLGDDQSGEPTSEREIPTCPDGRPHPLASDVRVREVALYQTVKVPLYYAEGRWIEERELPVVADKRALVRVFVEPTEGAFARRLRAVLRLEHAGITRLLADEKEIRRASRENERSSTFELRIPSDLLTADTHMSLAIEELACDAPAGKGSDARVPATGVVPLRAEPTGTLRVVLVPMAVEGRIPSPTPKELADVRATLLAYYPVARVELSVRAAIPGVSEFNTDHEAPKSGPTHDLLQRLCEQRKRDRPAEDVFYMGLFQPGVTRNAHCPQGRACKLGLANYLPEPQPDAQCGVASYFADDKSYETIAHELAHNHGLSHAPCKDEDEADPDYPDRQGYTITWGWNGHADELMPPTRRDLMSYCAPYWISGYHYRRLAARRRLLDGAPQPLLAHGLATASIARSREVLWLRSGFARWSSSVDATMPSGGREPARVLDARGRELARIELVLTALSDDEGAFVHLPEPGPEWSTIVWEGGRLDLSTVEPPL